VTKGSFEAVEVDISQVVKSITRLKKHSVFFALCFFIVSILVCFVTVLSHLSGQPGSSNLLATSLAAGYLITGLGVMYLIVHHRKLLFFIPLLIVFLLLFTGTMALATFQLARSLDRPIVATVSFLCLILPAWSAILLSAFSTCSAIFWSLRPLFPLPMNYLSVLRIVAPTLMRRSVSYLPIARNRWRFLFIDKILPGTVAFLTVGYVVFLLSWITRDPTPPSGALFPVIVGPLVGLAVVAVVWWLKLRYKYYGSVDASAVLAFDARPPIIFLRSFTDDSVEVVVRMFPAERRLRLVSPITQFDGGAGSAIDGRRA